MKFILNNLKKIFFNKREVLFISSEEDLAKNINDIFSSNIIAIDTEFDWRDTYFPKLSLIQICNCKKTYLIDFLCLEKKTDLIRKFKEQDRIFIFHSVRSDTTVLYSNMNIKLQNVFDIQIAEKIISGNGIENYGSIVKKYMNLSLSKKETLSNWLKRPLTEEQINYAANDVNFLIEIYRKQKKILKKKNLFQKAIFQSKEQASLGNKEIYFSRLNKTKMNKQEKKLFMWREKIASKKNIPISHIFKDKDIKPIIKNIKIGDSKAISKYFSDSNLSLMLLKEFKK